MKRIALFLATNFAILVVISITFRLLGLDRMVMQAGQVSMTQLLVFAAVIGFSGSIISLLMSKTMAKHGMGVQIIEEPANETQRWLVETVRRQAEAAGIGMPEVGYLRVAGPQRLRDRLEPQQRACCRQHRPAGPHGPRRGGGRAGPRGQPRRQR